MDRVKRGKGFRGVLNYAFANDNGDLPGKVIGGNIWGDNARDMARQFGISRKMRPDIEKPVWHQSLRLSKGEKLSNEKWAQIVDDYMTRMGFSDDHQRTYIMHDDEKGQGIHIIASRISLSGKLYLGQNENLIITSIVQQLEKDHGLTITKGAEYDQETGKVIMPDKKKPTKNEIEKSERTGENIPRVELQNLVMEAKLDNPDILVFMDRLTKKGVSVIPNIASTGRMNGFGFGLNGLSFSGSKLGKEFVWNQLKNEVNYNPERDFDFDNKKLKTIQDAYPVTHATQETHNDRNHNHNHPSSQHPDIQRGSPPASLFNMQNVHELAYLFDKGGVKDILQLDASGQLQQRAAQPIDIGMLEIQTIGIIEEIEMQKVNDENIIEKEANKLRESIEKVNKENEELETKRRALSYSIAKSDVFVYGKNTGNHNYTKSIEWKRAEKSGATHDVNKIVFPSDFDTLKEPQKTQVAIDIHVASVIRWGNDYRTNSDNQHIIDYMELIKFKNIELIEKRAGKFMEYRRAEDTSARVQMRKMGWSYDDPSTIPKPQETLSQRALRLRAEADRLRELASKKRHPPTPPTRGRVESDIRINIKKGHFVGQAFTLYEARKFQEEAQNELKIYQEEHDKKGFFARMTESQELKNARENLNHVNDLSDLIADTLKSEKATKIIDEKMDDLQSEFKIDSVIFEGWKSEASMVVEAVEKATQAEREARLEQERLHPDDQPHNHGDHAHDDPISQGVIMGR